MSDLAPLFDIDHEHVRFQFTKRDFLIMLFKHKAIILGCFLGVTLLVALGLFFLPSTYVAEATLLIKTEQQGSPSFLSGITAYREPRDTDPSNRKIETEMEVLAARPLAEEVVKTLDISYDDVYHLPITILSNPIVDQINWFKENVLHKPPTKDRYGFRDTVQEFGKALTVEPMKSKSADTGSNLIKVSLKAANPETAQKALDLLVKSYIDYRGGIELRSGKKAQDIVRAALASSEQRMMEIQQQLNKLQARKGEIARAALSESGARSTQAKGSDAGTPSDNAGSHDELSADSTLGMLQSRLVRLELELAEARLVYTDKAELVGTLKGTIADLKQRIAREMAASAEKSDAVLTLQRELKSAEEVYLDLKKKLSQIALFLEMTPTQNDSRVVIEPPLQPETSEWKKTAVIGIIGALAGLLLGLAIGGFREYSDHTLQSKNDIDVYLGIDLLGIVPAMDGKALTRSLTTY